MTGEHLGNYLYISKRLVTDILNEPGAPAARPGWEQEVRVESPPTPFGKVSTTSKRAAARAESVVQQAQRATAYLRKRTGSLREPGKPYLRMRLDAYIGEFSVVAGWEWDGPDLPPFSPDHRVVMLGAAHRIEGRRTFVALIGSQHNLDYDNPREPIRLSPGRTPSDIDGLYALFHAIREPADPGVDQVSMERSSEMTAEEIAADAMAILMGSPGGALRRVEVLVKRHLPPLEDVVLSDRQGPFDIVILGAPVWIREVLTEEGLLAPPRRDALGGARFKYFNDARRRLNLLLQRRRELHRAISGSRPRPDDGRQADSAAASGDDRQYQDVVNAELELMSETLTSVVKDDQWPAFAEWFAQQAYTEGLPYVRLSVERITPWWKKPFDRDWYFRLPESTEIAGYVVQLDPDDGEDLSSPAWYSSAQGLVLVTRTGDIYPVNVERFYRSHEARVVYEHDAKGDKTGIPKRARPTPKPHLRDRAAWAMWKQAFTWRDTLDRTDAADSPWARDHFLNRATDSNPAQDPELTLIRHSYVLAESTGIPPMAGLDWKPEEIAADGAGDETDPSSRPSQRPDVLER